MDIDWIKNVIEEAGSVLEHKRLLECRELCKQLKQKCSQAMPEYSYYGVLYQKRYFEDVYDYYNDFSMILFNDGRPCGLWPLCVFIGKGKMTMGSNGSKLLPPVLWDGMGNKETKRKYFQKCIDFLIYIKDMLNPA